MDDTSISVWLYTCTRKEQNGQQKRLHTRLERAVLHGRQNDLVRLVVAHRVEVLLQRHALAQVRQRNGRVVQDLEAVGVQKVTRPHLHRCMRGGTLVSFWRVCSRRDRFNMKGGSHGSRRAESRATTAVQAHVRCAALGMLILSMLEKQGMASAT